MALSKQHHLLQLINQLYSFSHLEQLYQQLPKMLCDLFEVEQALLMVDTTDHPQVYRHQIPGSEHQASDDDTMQQGLHRIITNPEANHVVTKKPASTSSPIIIGTKTVAAIQIIQPIKKMRFYKNDVAFFQDFVVQIAGALRVLMLRTEHQIDHNALPSKYVLASSAPIEVNLTEALLDISKALTNAQPLKTSFNRILENVQRIIPSDAANIMLIEGSSFVIASEIGYEQFGLSSDWGVDFGKTMEASKAFEPFMTHSTTTYIADTNQVTDWIPFPGFEWIQSHAKATLKIGDELIGILNLDSQHIGTFRAEQMEVLRLFANQAALAIYVARLLEQERERHQVEEMLRESARFLNETLDLDEVLTRIMAQIGHVANCDTGSLQVLQDGIMEIAACHGFDDVSSVIGQTFDIVDDPIFAQIMKEQSPLLFEDATAVPHFQKYFAQHNDILFRTWLGVPLIVRGNLIGMITLDRVEAKPFNEDEIERAVAFANHAAIALENARLHSEVSERAVEKERSWSQAVETNRVRTQLITNVAHDIRSPLSTVVTSLIMLREGTFGQLSKDQQDWVQTCISNLDHVLRLSQDFFDFTKSEMGQLAIYPTAVEVGVFLSRVYRLGQSLPWKDDVDFQYEFTENLPVVRLDKTRIQQVLMNLLYNSLKFTEQGQVTLYARYYKDDPTIRIGVRDTGIGISSEDLGSIFERFKQAGETRHRQEGSGIGLAICREIMRLHAGEIFVESELGVGSDFYVALPVST